MKKNGILKVVIFGAGGLGGEVFEAIRALQETGQPILCVGFAVDPTFWNGGDRSGTPIRGDFTMLHEDPETRVIVAVGSPRARRRIVQEFESAIGPRFASVIHPAACIGSSSTVGAGTMILGPASITSDVVVGRNALINPMVTISHKCRLGDYATLGPAVALAGEVRVEEGAELGVGATVIPRTAVGAWSVVGAGAVVLRDVAPDSTVAGVPARPLPDGSKASGAPAN